MMKTNKADLKKELIFKAVSQIVIEDGVEKLTLEAVAHKAGISKGGLLYHFPNKEALILGVIDQLSNRFMEQFDKRAEDDQDSKGKWTRSYIDCASPGENDLDSLYTALSAAHFTNPQMLQQLQSFYSEIQNKIEHDEVDPVGATLVRLAIDGLWFAEMFGLAPPGADLRKQVIERLKATIQEEA
jgi:AcrR family transcriptional regulator